MATDFEDSATMKALKERAVCLEDQISDYREEVERRRLAFNKAAVLMQEASVVHEAAKREQAEAQEALAAVNRALIVLRKEHDFIEGN